MAGISSPPSLQQVRRNSPFRLFCLGKGLADFNPDACVDAYTTKSIFLKKFKKGPDGSFNCSYINVRTNQKTYFIVLFRKGPKVHLPLYVRSWGTVKI